MSDTTGVTPFGYSQVDEATTLILTLLPQELRQFAERLTQRNPIIASQLVDLLLAAKINQIAPADAERHERIKSKLVALVDYEDDLQSIAAWQRIMVDEDWLALLNAAQ